MNRFERLTNGPIKELLKEADALVVSEANNIFYTADMVPATLRVVPDRLWLPVFHAKSDPFWVIADITEAAVRKQSKHIKNYVIYQEFVKSPVKALAEALLERGFTHKRIYVEMDNLVAEYYEELKALLPGVEILNAAPFLSKIRMIKTAEEIQELKFRANLTLEALRESYRETRIGETEIEIQGRAVSNLFKKGFDTLEFLSFARGRTDALNVKPCDDRLELGDMLRIDFGGILKGWRSDIHRTAVAGKPSTGQADGWKKNREVHYKTIETMQPGNKVSDTYHFCINEYPKYGLTCGMPHIGHSIGVAQHEMPIVSPFATSVYEPGMTFMLEPMGVDPAVGGFCIEDLIVITENGPRVYSDAVGTEEMIIIGQ